MDASVPIFKQKLGPLGLDVPPAGECTFEELVEEYRNLLTADGGAIHINCMMTMAECRAAILAAGERGCGPMWVSWGCDEDGEAHSRVHMLAALFVAEGMGAAAFGLNCPEELAQELLEELTPYASVPLFYVVDGCPVVWPYEPAEHDPDVIPCASGNPACFVTRTVDVGEELECTPDLLEDIIDAEDDPVGAVKIAILEQDDVDSFAEEQYAITKALCLWSDVPELLEGALRVYQGRAFYDGTGDLERADLDRLSKLYGLIVL
jgi:5-methyltetrahydrofolate--homocysteine methyltransferase